MSLSPDIELFGGKGECAWESNPLYRRRLGDVSDVSHLYSDIVEANTSPMLKALPPFPALSPILPPLTHPPSPLLTHPPSPHFPHPFLHLLPTSTCSNFFGLYKVRNTSPPTYYSMF